MEITFFPYDFEYKVDGDITFIYIYARQTDGCRICIIHKYEPYFYASVENVDNAALERRLQSLVINSLSGPAKVVSWEPVAKELRGKKEQFWKITVNYPKAVPVIAEKLESWDIVCYERDIVFVHRYLRDNSIIPMTLTTADGRFRPHKPTKNDHSAAIPVFDAATVQPLSSETFPKWKMLAVDIETYAERKEIDPEKNPILMIAFYGKDHTNKEFTKVITWKEIRSATMSAEYLEIVDDEAALINRFTEIIAEFQPDIVTGYFSDGFDLPYLKTRASKYKISLNLGLDGSPLIVNSSAGFRESVCKISGMLHLDVLKFIKNIFGKNLKTDSYSLNAVAGELLGHHKHDVNLDQLSIFWDNNNAHELLKFCEYNLHDARLTFQLCRHLLHDIIEFTKIIGLPTFDVIRMSSSKLVENYILRRAMEFNVIAPNRPGNYEMEQRRRDSVQGAFVYEPTPGLYNDIIIFDFRSLYPTIITSHNLGPEGFQCPCCREKAAVPGLKNQWFCIREKKFMPSVLEALISLRTAVKKELKEVKKGTGDNRSDDTAIAMLESRSYALKILANSFYGYLGFFGARWYSLESAAATTAYARDYITRTITQAQQHHFDVIYADTDSCFLLLKDKTQDDALAFMKEINQQLPGNMELECEGHYTKGIFVSVKRSNRGAKDRGAKKRYALLSESGKLKITGFETVRRNSSPLAKDVQQTVLQLVLTDKTKEALEYVATVTQNLRSGVIPLEKLIIKTQITRELSSYTALGPHVKVAREMAAKGERIAPGKIISYIIVKGKGLIRDRAKIPEDVTDKEYDADYYLHHQLIPAVSSIFAVLGYPEDSLFQESSQTGLNTFF
ncbi:MAG: DNA-directed DNA polymerase [Nanoarchaeota archaeon]|nr:DNA-directed DNA polymerase [Nanoarchaeota archaeon]